MSKLSNTASISLALVDPKSPANVGAVMRAASCFDADAVFYSGQRYDKAMRFNTDTKNSTQRIPLRFAIDLLEQVPENVAIVCVELVEGATRLMDFQHPEKAFYIFGPEDGTLSQKIIDQADSVVFIPTTGCMNLAATVNVVLYDRMAKATLLININEHIRQNRDTNNNVVVKTLNDEAKM